MIFPSMASDAPKILDTKSNISCTGRTYNSAGTTRLGPSFPDYRKDSKPRPQHEQLDTAE